MLTLLPRGAGPVRACQLILLWIILFASQAHAGWYDSTWHYRKSITIDPAQVPSDQSDFPVLINLAGDSELQTHAQSDGDDILFTDADGTTKLSHEIEQYTAGSGALTAWVKVPLVSSSSNTVIYLYYGNGTIGSQEDAANVWISDYVGVWHLDEEQAGRGNAGLYEDSTLPAYDGDDHTPSTGQDGQIGDGQQFGGDGEYVRVAPDPALNLTGPMTISFWIRPTITSGQWNRIVEKGLFGFQSAYYFGGGDGTNDLTFYLNNTEVFDTADGILNVGVWQHAAVTYAASGDATLFLDGTAIPSGNYSGAIAGNADTLYICFPDTTYDFTGYVDEVRIASTALPDDWIITEYNNQVDPGTFYTLGSPTAIIAGRVFEDVDFTGTASAYDGGTTDLTLPNVDVELYDAGAGDTLMTSVVTAGDGTFTFVGLVDGTYKVRARSATIGDTDTPPAGGLNGTVPGTWPYPLPEMTWADGAALPGGQDPTVDDTDTADDAGPGDTYVSVTVSGGDETGVDLGFAYSLVVNTRDDGAADNSQSDQGSLRQFIKNANAIGAAGSTTANVSAFRIPGAGPHTVQPVNGLPSLSDEVELDGDDGSGGRIVVDGASAGDVVGLTLATSDNVARNLVIQNYTGASSSGVRISDGSTGNTLANCLIQGHTNDGVRMEWLGADATLDHTIDGCTISGNGHDGVFMINADGNTITNNLIETNTRHGINVVGASNGSGSNLLAGNTIRSNGSQGVSIWDTGSSNNVFHSNILHDNWFSGIQVGGGGDGTELYHNVHDGNGASGGGSGITINSGVVGVVIRNSLFTSNSSYGVVDGDGGASTSIDYNDFFGNGTAACNYDCMTGSQNLSLDPQYAAPGPPTSFGLTECTSPVVDQGLDLGASQPDMNGAGAGNYNGPAPDMGALETSCGATYAISGLVFEDADFGGTASAYDGGASDLALANVDVELYDADGGDAYVTSVATDGTGSFSFAGLANGNYKIRVRSATVGDADTPPAGGLDGTVPGTWPYPLPEMTWGDGAALYGGQSATVDDADTGDDAGPGDTHVDVSVGGADVTGVDFGFAYNLIVNTLDDGLADATRSDQGSLRQFIKNANAVGDGGGTTASSSQFRIPGGGAKTISPIAILPAMTDEQTTLDGYTQPGAQINTVPLPGATDAVLTIELDGTGAGAAVDGMTLSGDQISVSGVAVNGFGGNGVVITGSDATVTGSYIGTDIAGTTAAPNTARGILIGGTATSVTIGGSAPGSANVVSGNSNQQIRIEGSANNVIIRGNLIGTDPSGTVDLGSNRGIELESSANPSNIVIGGVNGGEGNLIAYNSSGIFGWWTGGGHRVEGNVIRDQSGVGLSLYAPDVVVAKNIIRDNGLRGLFIANGGTGIKLYHNTIHGNADAGVQVNTGGSIVLHNNVITGNVGLGVYLNGGSFVTESHNLITDASTNPANAGRCNAGLDPTDLNADPLYVDEPSGDLRLTECTSPAINAGTDLGVDQPDMNGAAAGNYNGPAPDMGVWETGCTATTHTISGVVFEDADFAGTASAYDGGASDLALANVDVELYDADGGDAYVTSAATDGTGAFSFAGLADGTYKVRVRSATLGDADTPPAAGLNATVPGTWPYPLAEMTWANGATLLGGQDASVDDTATGDDAGPGDTWVAVSVSGGDLTGVNLGFAYNLIVNTLDDGQADISRSDQGSLRQFLKNSNAIGGIETSHFVIEAPLVAGAHTIQPTVALPHIVDPAVIDGTTESDFAGTPVIELDGSLAPVGTAGLTISGSGTTVRGLAINRFPLDGVDIDGADANVLVGNHIGTSVTGATDLPNAGNGIIIRGSATANRIGGTGAGEGNLISANGANGLHIEGDGGNTILGNLIGTDLAGAAGLGNADNGIYVFGSPDNTIGGTVAAARNVVSGNVDNGIRINGTAATSNVVQGNYVGLNAAGDAALPNGDEGIDLNNAPGNTVGGSVAGAGNVVSGNGDVGVLVTGNLATGNDIVGNRIGTDASGLAPVGNVGAGVEIDAAGTVVGGTIAGTGNLISSNGDAGIHVLGAGAPGTVIQGNYIGTDAVGSSDLGNTSDGIHIDDSRATIGGTGADDGNVISGNDNAGIYVTGGNATGTVIEGNIIGLDPAGDALLGNGNDGIIIEATTGVRVGGTAAGAGNVISGNQDAGNQADGIWINGGGSHIVQGNLMGTDITGNLSRGNFNAGVTMTGSSDNLIGGTTPAAGNVFAFNGGNGVLVYSGGLRNSIIGNSIFENVQLGIDLGNDGLTSNDGGDPDPGSNELLNFPEIVTGIATEDTVIVEFDLDVPAGSYRVEFFRNPSGDDPSGYGEGEMFADATVVTHAGTGPERFTHSFAGAEGDIITATTTECDDGAPCTDPGSTSEFSASATVDGSLTIVKRAFLTDGTPISDGATLPGGTIVKYLLYINNPGGVVSDVSVQDILDPAFIYIANSMKLDSSRPSCALTDCTGAEEAAIYTAADAGTPGSDAVDGDVVRFNTTTIDVGNQNAANAQLDLSGDRVWALLFEVRID